MLWDKGSIPVGGGMSQDGNIDEFLDQVLVWTTFCQILFGLIEEKIICADIQACQILKPDSNDGLTFLLTSE